ncbi:MAG TPA: type 4a pilus biogenesis protein PilO [Gemmatimonadales bacterium]|nr:type 4a pilus biogenesis protein PilO [Gemmatimonadales bacterium]
MALLDSPRNKALLGIVFALLLGYVVYSGEGLATFGLSGLRAKRAAVTAARDSIALMAAQNDSVRRELATGSRADLEKKTEAYRGTLETLRQLVPDRGEVPGLIDAISARAKSRRVHLAVFNPDPVEPGPAPFDTYRYKLSVIGHYDQIGAFLADVAGLRRIIVPAEVSLIAANPASARALGDTSSAMLEAKLTVKTYVKAGPEGGASRAP